MPTLSPERRPRSGKGGYPIHWRNAWLTAFSAVLLAGCGGGGAETKETAPGPRIERATAEQLAGLSDEVARRLESGDQCGAAESAVQLRDGVTEAINAGAIPSIYLEDLSGLANELEALIPPCVEPAPPSEPTEEDDGKDKKDKDKDKDEGDD